MLRSATIVSECGSIDLIVEGVGVLERELPKPFSLLVDHILDRLLEVVVGVKPALIQLATDGESAPLRMSERFQIESRDTTVHVEIMLRGFNGVDMGTADQVLAVAMAGIRPCIVHVLDDPKGEKVEPMKMSFIDLSEQDPSSFGDFLDALLGDGKEEPVVKKMSFRDLGDQSPKSFADFLDSLIEGWPEDTKRGGKG